MTKFYIGILFIQFIVKMGNSFEIGDVVSWQINDSISCVGVYLQELDSEFSEIKCHSKNQVRCICTLKVLTKILKKK